MTVQGVTAFAPAKVNLALHVTGRRPDGYHLLDSLVMFADFGDGLSVRPAEVSGMSVTGTMAAGVPVDSSNLCLRAATAFGETVHVSLEKRLPAGAGIGGGSSDAAAVLRAMTRLYRRPFAGNPVDLGADIPVCLHGRAARMQGIGDIVAPVAIAELPAVLVNPGVAVSTPDVFAALTRRDGPAMADIGRSLARFDDALCWISEQRNDMQDAAVSLQPVIGDVLSALDAAGSRCTRMSGSGATCFGLFASKAGAETAAGHLRDTYPDWWVQAVTLS